MNFEPEILALACNWCGYSAADQAGSAKIQYPPNIRIARIMCLGMVDPYVVMRAFEIGFDGVILIGCHEGNCHYLSGNIAAQDVVKKLHILLRALGLGQGRLAIDAASASEGPEFAEIVTEFTNQIRKMGPSPLRSV